MNEQASTTRPIELVRSRAFFWHHGDQPAFSAVDQKGHVLEGPATLRALCDAEAARRNVDGITRAAGLMVDLEAAEGLGVVESLGPKDLGEPERKRINDLIDGWAEHTYVEPRGPNAKGQKLVIALALACLPKGFLGQATLPNGVKIQVRRSSTVTFSADQDRWKSPGGPEQFPSADARTTGWLVKLLCVDLPAMGATYDLPLAQLAASYAVDRGGLPRGVLPAAVSALARPPQDPWLVDEVIHRGRGGVLGGPPKSLKTLLALDAAVSVASGTPMLGTFEVQERGPVVVVSTESGPDVIVPRLAAIAAARGLDWSSLPIFLSCRRARLTGKWLREMEALCRRCGAKLLILDPFYLIADAVAAGASIYAVGVELRKLDKLMEASGVSVLLCHHFTRSSKGAPALEHLAYAGVDAWARTWFLVRHTKRYRLGGPHDLAATLYGPRHYGLRVWDRDVSTGEPVWQVEVSPLGSEKADESASSATDGDDAKVLAALAKLGVATARQIRAEAKLGLERVMKALERLFDAKVIDKRQTTRRGQPCEEYRLR
jgi:hypothetical protein